MNIYVGNLSYRMNDQDLEELFAKFGEVKSCKIVNDRETGRSKGFGFIEMDAEQDGQNAVNELNGKEVEGRTLKVNEARPRAPRERRAY